MKKTTAHTNRPLQTGMASALAIVCLLLSQSAFVSAFKHVHLLRSEPAADSTLHAAPTEIRFWFSAPVQVPVMTVRMTDSTNHPVETAKVRLGTGANAPVIADIKGRVVPGRYTVSWRTMSRDGHVVSGHFHFTLAAPAAPSH